MSGMNSDRVVTGCELRASKGRALGSCIITLQRTQLDPFRDFMIWLSKRKKYDLCELLLPQSVLEWNDGIAIDPQHPLWIEYLEEIARRAVAANKGKFEGIHQQHKKAATGAR